MTIAELYGIVFVSIGHVMIIEGVTAADAWSREYEDRHIKYLTDNEIPLATAQELLDKPLSHFI